MARRADRRDRGLRGERSGQSRLSGTDRPQSIDVRRSGNMVRLPDPSGPLRELDDTARRGDPAPGAGTRHGGARGHSGAGSTVSGLRSHSSRGWLQRRAESTPSGAARAPFSRTGRVRASGGNSKGPASTPAVCVERQSVGLISPTLRLDRLSRAARFSGASPSRSDAGSRSGQSRRRNTRAPGGGKSACRTGGSGSERSCRPHWTVCPYSWVPPGRGAEPTGR